MTQPSPLNRRDVLRTATLLGLSAASLAAPASAEEKEPPFGKDSGLITGKPKKLKYESVPGLLTKEQVAPHYKAHYGGALTRYLVVEEKLDKLLAGKEPLAGDAHTWLQKDKLNRMNSVLLHEL